MLGWRARVSSFEECGCLVQFGAADVVGPSGDRFSRCLGTGQTAVSQIQGCGRTSRLFLDQGLRPSSDNSDDASKHSFGNTTVATVAESESTKAAATRSRGPRNSI